MAPSISMIGAALLGAVLSFGPALACPVGATPAALSAVAPNRGDHDPRLLDQAILHFTNKARCDRGLTAFDLDRALTRAAAIQAEAMVAQDTFAHETRAPGAETMRQRFDSAGVRYRRAAENLISGYFMIYKAGESFIIENAATCRFRNAATDRPLRRQTYATIGEGLVARWMASPGHRANILDQNIDRHGAALAPTGDPALCGEFYATQVFAG